MASLTTFQGMNIVSPNPTGDGGLAIQENFINLATWNPQSSWGQLRNPVATDDSTEGYYAGSLWLNTTASPAQLFVCELPTPSAAVWLPVLLDVVQDTSPELGGNLNVNGNKIVDAAGVTITIAGIDIAKVTSAGMQVPALGIGVAAGGSIGLLESQATSGAQIAASYNGSNYCTLSVGSTGSTTFALTGTSPTFTFNETININGGSLTATLNQNAGSYLSINNNSTGTSAYCGFAAVGNGINANLIAFGAAYTSGSQYQSTAMLYTGGAYPLLFGVNSAEVARFNASGQLLIGNHGTALGTLESRATSGAQIASSYDSNDYMTITTTSNGNTLFGLAGTSPVFIFSGTTGLSWGAVTTTTGQLTVGSTGTGGSSLMVNTPSLNMYYGSGLGVDGTYSNPGGVGTALVRLKALGVYSGGGYNSAMSFSTSLGTSVIEGMRLTNTGLGIGTTAPVSLFSVGSASQFQVNTSGLIPEYNGIATVGNGVAAEYAKVESTALTASVSVTTLYAVPAGAGGMYRVSGMIVETTAGPISSTLPNLQVIYTDNETGGTVTIDATPIAASATLGQTGPLSGNTVGLTASGVIVINAKALTNIQYQTVNYASNAAGMAYSLHVKLEAM